MLELLVPDQMAPIAAKDFLRQSGLSLTLRRKIKHHGTMTCNSQPIAWNDYIAPGDRLQVTWPTGSTLTPQALPLTIVYEDEAVLIVDKPAGLMVHPTARKMRSLLPTLYCTIMNQQASPSPSIPFTALTGKHQAWY